MKKLPLRRVLGFQGLVLLAVVLGVVCSLSPLPGQNALAHGIMTTFMNALRLVSLPIIFLAVTTTIMGMETLADLAWLGRRVLTYTLLTTVLAASVALALFVCFRPVIDVTSLGGTVAPAPSGTYADALWRIVPSSIFQPFLEGNVTAVLILAVVFGVAMLQVNERAHVYAPLSAILKGLLRVIRGITYGVPWVVWAGIVESFPTLTQGGVAPMLFRYLACVVAANVLQAFVVLPLVLRAHGLHPGPLARVFTPALSMAFFSKSSVATLPVAMRVAEDEQKLAPKVVRFCFPMCTSINMNGCAAFILLTVLFVSTSNGRVYNVFELVGFVFLATVAALGNAGVPMGCYFLACALLATMNVPLTLMALILPFYSFIDMLETAVNVWSDISVATLVDKQYQARPSALHADTPIPLHTPQRAAL